MSFFVKNIKKALYSYSIEIPKNFRWINAFSIKRHVAVEPVYDNTYIKRENRCEN